MALLFFPRGGSSQVVRYVARSLPEAGWDVSLLAGSLGAVGEHSHAETFFAGLDVHAVDYTAARDAPDPLAANPPFHPSFEDRPGAPDRVFAKVDDALFERHVEFWQRQLQEAGAAEADLLHVHHLSPINEAVLRSFPDKPLVGHLHGTELLMLREIENGPPAGWEHAEGWADRMRRWAQACDRVLVLSTDAVERVPGLLGVDPERVVWAPNGFDPAAFDRRPVTGEERVRFWKSWLVDEPRGWAPGGEAGSIAYTDAELEPFREGPVITYVGRYTEVKRIPLLIRAYAKAREHFRVRAPLVIVGGYPGEWEGPHPAEVMQELGGVPDVFLAGWHGHDELPAGLNASDVLVLPSVHEQFGQVLVEAMACGLPVIGANAHGPATIIDHGATGWLVEPDDEQGMAAALIEAVNDDEERRRRGEAAYTESRSKYSWPALAKGVAGAYQAAAESRRRSASYRGRG